MATGLLTSNPNPSNPNPIGSLSKKKAEEKTHLTTLLMGGWRWGCYIYPQPSSIVSPNEFIQDSGEVKLT